MNDIIIYLPIKEILQRHKEFIYILSMLEYVASVY